jgi:glyoxylase-like metal-dependent hydrolase (beta-lactamase superfamily II)
MRIGKYDIYEINSGYFKLDGGAMFGIIPKPLWSKNNPADDQNRISLAARNMLLVSDNRKILIDTGMGNKFDEKAHGIYDIKQDEFSLESSLKKIGFTHDDITDVILTHLHFDHTGGSTKMSDNGKLVPAFSNAKYYVSEKNFNWASKPSDRDKGSYLKENFIPLAEEGVLCFLNDKNFDDEIEFIEVNGHTFGQNLLKISDSSTTLFYCADLFPFKSHIPLPYIMGYDLQPLVTLEEKKKVLPQAVEEEWIFFFEHDPFSAAAKVIKTDKGFKADELPGIF